MNLKKPIALACAGLLAFVVNAQESQRKVVLHGSVQSDVLIPEEDKDINTGSYDDWGLTNTYVDLNLMSKNVEAGARLEFTEYPLPGFENDFQGWGVPHIYIKGISDFGFDVTVGDFYDQFGSGFIFRTYEERSLGIDNALRGARLNVTALKGVQFKVLGGLQRRYWDWKHGAWVGGADLEVNLEQYSRGMQDKGITWMVGASGVLKQEGDEDILVSGTNYRLNLPRSVGAFDVRSRFQKGDYSVMAEYAWKSQDPSFDNGYIYRRGSALMLSASYSNAVIFPTLRTCFSSPEKGVSRNVSTMLRARFFPTIPAPIASMFASLCSLVSLADTVSAQSAHRIPLTLLATMEIPIPVVQITMPLSHFPDATASAAARPKSG